MRVGLIPLDERPVNTRYPEQIAAIAGVELVLPPSELRSSLRIPAPADALADWLVQTAPGLDAVIVSCEMLGYGGLIASRITDEGAAAIVQRLDRLRVVKSVHPSLQILGFNVVTRVSNADDAIEEPSYWAEYGRRMYRLSQMLDRQARGEEVDPDLAALMADIPPEHRRDFLWRRLRNHTINLHMLGQLADGTLDLLVLSSDDTSPYGLPTREKAWVAEVAGRLDLGDRLLMYPGADEVGCALLGRLINQAHGRQPRFAVRFVVPGGESVVAPYEDGPVRVTVERQVNAVGGVIGNDDADLLLVVNPPVERRSEWHPDHAHEEREARLPFLTAAVDDIAALGMPVVVCDVAYPNGADPVLVDLLREQVDLPRLAAYGAWNTAGNTIGTALAQGCAKLDADHPDQQEAAERFLLHRFVEDWGYQQIVRRQARARLLATTGQPEPSAEHLAATAAYVEEHLQALISDLPGFAGRWQIVPGSVRHPWNRNFEIDFELERVAHGST